MNSIFAAFALLAAPVASEKIQFVATVPDLKDIVEQIGGEKVEGISLSSGKQDPHFIDPKPTYIVKLRKADLFVLTGLDLEIGYAQPLLEGARNSKILRGGKGYLDASVGIAALEIPSAGTTRTEGDVHPHGNPHYLLDPLNGKIVASSVAEKLKEIDPQNAAFYDSKLQAFDKNLDEALFGRDLVAAIGGAKLERLTREGELDRFLESTDAGNKKLSALLGGWMGKLRPLRGSKVISFHKNLFYFCKRFGLEEVGYVEPKAGIPPSAAHLVELEHMIPKQKAKWILTQSFYDNHAPNLLAEKTGIRVLVIPTSVGAEPGADHYISLFDAIVNRIVSAGP